MSHPTDIPSREVKFMARRNKHVSYQKYHVLDWDRRDLIAEVKETGLVLFEYYLSLVNKQSTEKITDEKTAHHLGWDISKAKRIRQILTQTGWFRMRSFSYTTGPAGTTYYLGKQEVEASYAGDTAAFQKAVCPALARNTKAPQLATSSVSCAVVPAEQPEKALSL